jgi:hypothetical protein
MTKRMTIQWSDETGSGGVTMRMTRMMLMEVFGHFVGHGEDGP